MMRQFERLFPFTVAGIRFRSVMSYDCGGVPVIDYFSNPDVLYDGQPTGTATENNARTIKENMVRCPHGVHVADMEALMVVDVVYFVDVVDVLFGKIRWCTLVAIT